MPDPEIIAECDKRGWVLLTADGRMEFVHFAAIRASNVAILVVPTNDKHPIRWAEEMVKGCAAVQRCISNHRPLVARLNAAGQVYQLKCISPADRSPAESAVLIRDGKADHESARKYRRRSG